MQKQHGFSLVLSLTLLIAIGGFALAGKGAGLRSRFSISDAVLANGELGQVRQALLSYSAHYPYLYGAKGAGVGHLPCPDTDAPIFGVTDWAINRGPNPPCGSYPAAVGNLPSHISFPEGRYMIHAGFGPQVEYEVSERIVNNPASHSVNPELLIQSPVAHLPPARLRTKGIGTSLHSTMANEILLSSTALMNDIG